jgi:hypothetical protein
MRTAFSKVGRNPRGTREILVEYPSEIKDALSADAFKLLPWAAAVALALPHMEKQAKG